MSDVLLWTPTYGRAKAGRPARTYIQQLCEDTGCSPEDMPEAMNYRGKWRERVWDISDDDDECNIMAKGFHFMPLDLVRLRTFWLSAWIT